MKRKLLLICVALLCAVGSWADGTPTASTPSAGNAYYIYNTGTGKFLFAKDATASVKIPYVATLGTAWLLENAGDGRVFIRMKNEEGKYLKDQYWGGIGSKGDNDAFALTTSDNKNYKLQRKVNNGYTYCWQENDGLDGYPKPNRVANNSDGQRGSDGNTLGEEFYTWQFISEADYATYIREQISSGLDVSDLMMNPDIKYATVQNTTPSGWLEFRYHGSNTNRTEGTGDTRLECYSNKTNNNYYFDYYTIVTGLPAGKYEVSASAHDRDDAGGYVYIYNRGNSEKKSGDISRSGDADATYTTPAILIAANGGVNIGVAMDENGSVKGGNRWITGDNFRLKYYGNAVETVSTTGTFSPAAEATSGKWYAVEIDDAGYYAITAGDALTFYYTQDGTKDADEGTFSTLTFTSSGTEHVLLDAGTLYFKTNATKNITIVFDDKIQYYAVALPDGGAMTHDQWYSVTIANEGYYDATASTLSDIVYTTDGETDKADEGGITENFDAANNLLSATTYYVKSSSDQTLTIAQSQDADLTFSFITNPSFETGYNQNPIPGWTVNNAPGGSTNENSRYKEGGFGEDGGSYRFFIWSPTAGIVTLSRTLSNLPAGNYKLTAYMATGSSSKLTLTAGGTSGKMIAPNGSGNLIEVYFTQATAGSLNIVASTDANWFEADNFHLIYNPSLPVSLTAISGKMNSDVKDDQATAVEDYSNDKTFANMLSAQSAMNDAIDSRIVYNKIATILSTYAAKAALLDSDGQTAYNIAKNADDTGAETMYEAGDYETAAQAEEAYHRDYITAVKAQTTDNTNMTEAIVNPSFETGDATGWINSGFKIPDNDGFANKSGTYFVDQWHVSGDKSIKQTLTGLHQGKYKLTAAAVANAGASSTKLYVKVGETETPTTVSTSGDYNVNFNYDGSSTLEIGFSTTLSAEGWAAVDNFRLTYLESYYATDADYSDLSDAITSAEARTLGFEDGEYAPYNNIAILTKLDEAIVIRDESPRTNHVRTDILDLTSVLESDGSWTANDGSVECVYNGDFSLGDWGLGGWSRPKSWGKNLPSDEPGVTVDILKAAGATTGSAYYNQTGSLVYGNTGYYTMPLKANTIYTLTFKYASYQGGEPGDDGSNDGITVSVLNDLDEGMDVYPYEENNKIYTTSGSFDTKTIKFVTGAAGNYVLTLANDGNTVMTDVSITKDAVQTLTLSQTGSPAYAAGTYPSVTLSRTLSEDNWNTLCLPFATPVSDYSAVKELTDVDVDGDHVSITFGNVVDGNLTAGKPYLVKGNGGTSISAENVSVLTEPITAPSVTDDETTVTYRGVFAPVDAIESNAGNYVVSNNNLYLVDDKVSLKGYRGYFNVGASAGVKQVVLNFDDVDVIKALEAAENENRVIYNLAGQRLNKAQKGVNIINGKKVLVK